MGSGEQITMREFISRANNAFATIAPTSEDIVVIRKTNDYPSVRAMIEGKTGDTFTSKGYLATTTRLSTVMWLQTNVYMEILVPKGSRVLSDEAISGGSSESEVVLNRNSKLTLLDAPVKDGGVWRLKLSLNA